MPEREPDAIASGRQPARRATRRCGRALGDAARAHGRDALRLGARRRALRGRLRPRACQQAHSADNISSSPMTSPAARKPGPQHVLPRVQRQRDDREPRHHRAAHGAHADPRLRGDRRQRRQRRRDRRDPRRAGPDLSRRSASCTTRRTAATAARCAAASPRPPASWSSTPTATPSTIRPRWPCCGTRFDDGVDLVNGYKISRSDPLHRIVIGRIYHHTVKMLFGLKVRDVDCDFRLMRRSIFDTVHLEKNSGVICLEMMKKITGRRVPHRRSAGAPLSPRATAVAVLQLPPAVRGPPST